MIRVTEVTTDYETGVLSLKAPIRDFEEGYEERYCREITDALDRVLIGIGKPNYGLVDQWAIRLRLVMTLTLENGECADLSSHFNFLPYEYYYGQHKEIFFDKLFQLRSRVYQLYQFKGKNRPYILTVHIHPTTDFSEKQREQLNELIDSRLDN